MLGTVVENTTRNGKQTREHNKKKRRKYIRKQYQNILNKGPFKYINTPFLQLFAPPPLTL